MLCLLKVQLLKEALVFGEVATWLLLQGCHSSEVINIAQGYDLLLGQLVDDQIYDSLAASDTHPEPEEEADVCGVLSLCV